MNIKNLYLTIIFFSSFISLQAQCGCLEDIFENDAEGNSQQIINLFDGGFFTEGPTVDSKGNVYFTDLTFTSETGNEPGHIWKYNPQTNETKIYRSPGNMANGMIIKNDTLFICEGADTGGRRIIKTELSTGKSYILADEFNGKRFNSPNDLTMTEDGIIYFTDPRYAGDEIIEQPVNGVYRLIPNGKVELIIDKISMPNGIAVTPDNKKLYVGCNDEN
ncbi:MAG: SMP-30/gluconolactonase/LRE family protein, partial [Melioribacteraceae bacterium]|nr:SMP-30/gluconolactonase/LRE family protein [Melioribacteraceae bacterium]